MPSIARILAVLLLVGGTALASPVVGRANLEECFYDKAIKFACSAQQAAEMMAAGPSSYPSGVSSVDFGAFLEDCCEKQGSSLRQADKTPAALNTAQGKKGDKAQLNVDESNRQPPALPLSLADKNENEKIDVSSMAALPLGTAQDKPTENAQVNVDQRKGAAGPSNAQKPSEVDLNAERKGAADPSTFSPAKPAEDAQIDVKDHRKAAAVPSTVQGPSENINLDDERVPSAAQGPSENVNLNGTADPSTLSLPLAPSPAKDAQVDVNGHRKAAAVPSAAQGPSENVNVNGEREGTADPSTFSLPFDQNNGGNMEVDLNGPKSTTAQGKQNNEKAQVDLNKGTSPSGAGQRNGATSTQNPEAQVDVNESTNAERKGSVFSPKAGETAQVKTPEGQQSGTVAGELMQLGSPILGDANKLEQGEGAGAKKADKSEDPLNKVEDCLCKKA
ncbi:hypothetical protein FB451DRAFT_1550318 [Mycena latifolia]|nr:hypothetical protein FB451DRAFT_1550318 [Mycena latifolia]